MVVRKPSSTPTLTSIGGIAAGTAAGRWGGPAHQRTSDLYSPTARLSAATVVGLTAALLANGLISGLATPLRRKIDAQHRLSAVSRDVRAEVARSACKDAAFTASFRRPVGDTGSKGYLKGRDLWRGYEDGTATYCFSPGTYLPFRPSHREQGDIVIDHRAHLLAAIVEFGGELELPATRNGRFRGAVIPEGCAVSAGRRRCGGRRPVR
ncbi:hypothetical protein OG696_00670 [Streptomyces sp. NBC_00656]|uniref:hypothetical protein n=1 Tax=Streptomyces sp. NBC_00656 TaxID=2903668 RepID=UPI00324A2A97